MRKVTVLLMVLCMVGSSLGANYWDNGTGNNNYADPGNWDSFPSSYPAVNMAGADRAIVSTDTSTLSTVASKLWIANHSGDTGEVEVATGGLLYADEFVHVGYEGDGTLKLDGGTITTNKYDVSIGDQAGSTGTLTMNSGTINSQRFFAVGADGTGTMTMNGGTVNVVSYDFQIGDGSGGQGTLNMYDGTINATRDVTVGGEGVGILNMYGGTINADGKITIPELEGGDGTLNLYDGTINAKLWMRNAENFDPSNEQLVQIKDGQIVMDDGDGTIAAAIQGYIDEGWVTGMSGYTAQVEWDDTALTTTVYAIPEPATVVMLGLGGLAMLRKRK